MNRLKVLVFALVALGLWVFNLTTLSQALATKAVEQTSLPLLGASGAIAQRIEASRSALQAATLKLAGNAALLQKNGAKAEAPTPDRFAAIRTAAFEGLPDSARSTAYIALVNDQGSLMALGTQDPTPAPDGFDVKAAASGGGEGMLLELNGTPCLFFSVPIIGIEKGEAKNVGAVVMGTPLWGAFATVDALADSVNKDLNLSGVGLWMSGKLVGGSGKKDVLEHAYKETKQGQTAVIERGTVMAMGPVKLPMFTGTANALEVASRRDIPGTPFEVVAIATARPFMESLAAAQKISLLLLLGLLAAGLVFTLLVSNGASAEEDDDAPVPMRMSAPPAPAPSAQSEGKTRAEPLPGSLLSSPPEAAREASPDDFHFPPPPEKAPSPSSPPSAFDGPADDPFAAAGPARTGGNAVTQQAVPVASMPPLSLADDDYENQRTTAYPAHRMPPMDSTTDSHAALDPFSMAGGSTPDPNGNGSMSPDFNPDATRVATIPPELLKAAQRSNSASNNPAVRSGPPVAAPRVASVAPVGGGTSDEEHHFQETFRDFLSTRQKCGEPNDGMTYDKFAAKLRKNKEQLVAKYNCKTVRFQVYVKDGKAALKATPVKD